MATTFSFFYLSSSISGYAINFSRSLCFKEFIKCTLSLDIPTKPSIWYYLYIVICNIFVESHYTTKSKKLLWLLTISSALTILVHTTFKTDVFHLITCCVIQKTMETAQTITILSSLNFKLFADSKVVLFVLQFNFNKLTSILLFVFGYQFLFKILCFCFRYSDYCFFSFLLVLLR